MNCFCRWFLMYLIFSLITSSNVYCKTDEFRQNYSPFYYDLSIFLDVDARFLLGKNHIHILALAPIDTLILDLDFRLKVVNVSRDNKGLEFKRDNNQIWVFFSSTIAENSHFDLIVEYEGTPEEAINPPWQGGFVWDTLSDGSPWIAVSCQADGAKIWWPLKDEIFEKPDSMQIHITLPEKFDVIANAQLRKTESKNGNKTHSWFISNPVNTYNVSFYAGRYTGFEINYISDEKEYPLKFFVRPEHSYHAQRHFRQTKEILGFMENTFGQFPWWNDGYKVVEAPYLGMEHQSAIAYGDKFKNNEFGFDYILFHETAHEWWGNSVTALNLEDIWIHEAFATYSEALYVEYLSGYENSIEYLKVQKKRILNNKPISDTLAGRENLRNSDIYFKGSWMLHSFRSTLNDDDLFFQLLKGLYQKYQKSFLPTSELISYINEKTNEDYTGFFYQFIFNAKPPLLKWSLENNELSLQWDQFNSQFNMPVEIWDGPINKRIKFPAGSEVVVFKLEYPDEFEFDLGRFYYEMEEVVD